MFLFYFDIIWGTWFATLNAGEDSWVGVWAGRSQLGKSFTFGLQKSLSRLRFQADETVSRMTTILFWQRTCTLNIEAIAMKEEFSVALQDLTLLVFCSNCSHGNHTRMLLCLDLSYTSSWPDTKDGSFRSRLDLNQWLMNGKHYIWLKKNCLSHKNTPLRLPKWKVSGADKGILVLWSGHDPFSSLLLQCFNAAVSKHALPPHI